MARDPLPALQLLTLARLCRLPPRSSGLGNQATAEGSIQGKYSMNVRHLLTLKSRALSGVYYNSLIKTISTGLYHPSVRSINLSSCSTSLWKMGWRPSQHLALHSCYCDRCIVSMRSVSAGACRWNTDHKRQCPSQQQGSKPFHRSCAECRGATQRPGKDARL